MTSSPAGVPRYVEGAWPELFVSTTPVCGLLPLTVNVTGIPIKGAPLASRTVAVTEACLPTSTVSVGGESVNDDDGAEIRGKPPANPKASAGPKPYSVNPKPTFPAAVSKV